MKLDPIQIGSVLFRTCIDLMRSDPVQLIVLAGGVVVVWCGLRIASSAMTVIGSLVQALASVGAALGLAVTALCVVAGGDVARSVSIRCEQN